MIDPDIDIGPDIEALNAGKFERIADDYIVNGRIYGYHPDMGTVYPKSGPGIINMDRVEHQLLKKLNSGTIDDAMQFAKHLPGLDQDKINKVLSLWKKCK